MQQATTQAAPQAAQAAEMVLQADPAAQGPQAGLGRCQHQSAPEKASWPVACRCRSQLSSSCSNLQPPAVKVLSHSKILRVSTLTAATQLAPAQEQPAAPQKLEAVQDSCQPARCCRTGLQPDWQAQPGVQQLQEQLQDKSASPDQLQAACQALLQSSQQLQQQERELARDSCSASEGTSATNRSTECQESQVDSNCGGGVPFRNSMRRWSNPVFSTSGSRKRERDPSMRPLTPTWGLERSAGGVDPTVAAARETPTEGLLRVRSRVMQLPVGPVSVSLDDCSAEVALEPHSTFELPQGASRLPPCELQRYSVFARPPTAQAAGNITSALQQGGLCRPAHLPSGPMAAQVWLSAAGSVAVSCSPWSVDPEGLGAPIRQKATSFATAQDMLSMSDAKELKGALQQPQQKQPAQQEHKPLGAVLQELLLALQRAHKVLGPAALTALQSCSSTLSPEELARALSVASESLADAAGVHEMLQVLAGQMLQLAQPQQAAPVLPFPIRVLTVSAGGTAAAADADSRGMRQDSGDNWTIAAAYTGNRISVGSHRSSGHTLDETMSPRFADMEHMHATSEGGCDTQAAGEAAEDAALHPEAADSPEPQQLQHVCSTAGGVRMPSLDLFDVRGSAGGYLDGSISAVFGPQSQFADAADEPTGAAAAHHLGTAAALGRSTSRPRSAPGAMHLGRTGLRYRSCDSSAVGYADHLVLEPLAELSPRQPLSCMPWRKAKKSTNKQPPQQLPQPSESSVDAPAAVAQRQLGKQVSDGALQHQVHLVWSLREQLAAAELKLQQQQQQQVKGGEISQYETQTSGKRMRAATLDDAAARLLALSSGGATAPGAAAVGRPRRNTCDTAALASPGPSSVQQALKQFLAVTGRPNGPAGQVVGSVKPDGHICIEPAAGAGAAGSMQGADENAECPETAAKQAATSSAADSEAVQERCGEGTSAQLQVQLQQAREQLEVEQQEGARLLQRLHSVQQHRLDAEALHAAAQREYEVTRVQRDAAEEHVLELQQQIEQTKQQLEQEHVAAAELQQQLRAAQQLQRAAEVTAAHVQVQQIQTQQQLLLAQQHEHELEQQLASTLQHLEAAAATAEHAAQRLQQEGQKQHDPADAATAAAQGTACASAAEFKLQKQLAEAQQEQQELQELLSTHQQLLTKLQEAATEAAATVAEQASTQQTTSEEERALLQQQLAAAQAQVAQVQAQLASSQAQVQEQQQALQEASWQAAQAARAAQQQLQEVQAEVQHMTELLALHESMLLRLQELQQAAATEPAAASCQALAKAAVMADIAAAAAAPGAEQPASVTRAEAVQNDGPDQHGAAAQQLEAKYNEQVIQQLAGEVGRLLAEQATAEGQLAAAAARNAALQAEVDSLSESLDALRQKSHHEHVAAHIASMRPTSAPAAPRQQADAAAGDAAQSGAHSQQQLLQELEHEHARQLILQQQLHHATGETAATAAQVARLQAQLQASQECNTELRSQLRSMAATLADLEAATAHSEVYEWPPSSHTSHAVHRPAADTCRQQQPEKRANGASEPATAVDADAQAALIRGLSDAINKQAELQAQLSQRDKQVQALTAQLCSTTGSPAAAGTQAQLRSMSGEAVLAAWQEAGSLPAWGTEQQGPSSSAATVSDSTMGQCDLAHEVAALLATSCRVSVAAARGEGADSTLAQEVAALLVSSRHTSAAAQSNWATAATVRSAESTLAQEVAALLARSRRVSAVAAAAAAGSAAELQAHDDSSTAKDATWEHSAASHSSAWGSDGGAAEQRTHFMINVAAPCGDREGCPTSGRSDKREDAHLGTWGSVEGRLSPGRGSGSNSRERNDEQQVEGGQLGAASAGREGLWGTNDCTRPEVSQGFTVVMQELIKRSGAAICTANWVDDPPSLLFWPYVMTASAAVPCSYVLLVAVYLQDAFAILRDLSLREREMEQLRTQLADSNTQLATTSTQLSALQAEHTATQDRFAELSLELYMLRAESAHRVSAAEAAVKSLQAELQARPKAPAAAAMAAAAGAGAFEGAAAAGGGGHMRPIRLKLCAYAGQGPASPGGCAEAVELPPSPAGVTPGSSPRAEAEEQQQEQQALSAEPDTAGAPAAAPPVNAAAAAAVTAHLLTKARAATARVAAAEAQHQQLAEQLDAAEAQQQHMARELAAAQAQRQQMLQELEAARAAAEAQQQHWAEVVEADRAAAEAQQQQTMQELAAARATADAQQLRLTQVLEAARTAAQAQQQQMAKTLGAERIAAAALQQQVAALLDAEKAAAQLQQQQLAEELALQHELLEVQQKEAAVLKQRLATADAEAARLGCSLQDKHQQLLQLQVQLQSLQQQHQQQLAAAAHAQRRKGAYAADVPAAAAVTQDPVPAAAPLTGRAGRAASPAHVGACARATGRPGAAASSPAAVAGAKTASILQSAAYSPGARGASPGGARRVSWPGPDRRLSGDFAGMAGQADGSDPAYKHAEEVGRLQHSCSQVANSRILPLGAARTDWVPVYTLACVC